MRVLVKRHDRLTFMPRGQLSGSALLMLTSPQLASLLNALREQYQRIIIDTSAVNQAQDSQLIGRQSDGVLLVIQSGRLQNQRSSSRCWLP
ncbi:Capsular polysaccharide biosynthesis protein [Kluyvera cryocrescens]|uniref:Capsular polysaccharide biosynthesis protein n=1 Tax=Kluyvera cryocrescens TaxID=580 RepID=A0A485D2Y9_KLUCR|nr:Capsular polysaccharide biosynthesis protein [Kluyvera cryocrescens]